MAESAINIVLNAIDKYSPALTGLNQGLELVGKGLDFVKSAAGLAFDAIKSGVGLAADGGNFSELTRQFNNVAGSFKVDGQAIIDDLNSVTDNILTMPEATKLAAKAITAGLTGDQISTAFEFIKRRTEATGEDFGALSETVFKALQTGKTSVLGSLGLVVEKGDTAAVIFDKMSEATKRYGDAGFNAGDSMATLANQQTSLTTALGVAINEVPLFQKGLQSMADAAVDLVKWFDPRPVTEFFDVFGTMAFDAAKSVLQTVPFFGDAFDAIAGLMGGTGSTMGDVTLKVSGYLFDILRTVGTISNGVLDILDQMGIVTLAEFTMSAIIEVLRVGGGVIGETVGAISASVLDGFGEIISGVAAFARANPVLADSIGLDPDKLTQMDIGFKKASASVVGLTDSFLTGIDKAADFGQKITAELSQATKTTRFDTSAIDDYEADLKKKIDGIDLTKNWQNALTKGSGSSLAASAISGLDAKLEAKEEAKEAKDAEKAAAKAKKDAEKSVIDAEKTAVKEASAAQKTEKTDKPDDKKVLSAAQEAVSKMKFTNFGIAMSPAAMAALEKSMPVIKPKFDLDAVSNDIKGKLEAEVNVKVLDGQKQTGNSNLPPDAALLQWILSVVKAGLVSMATGEGMPMVVTA